MKRIWTHSLLTVYLKKYIWILIMEVNGDAIYSDGYQGQEINSKQPKSMYKE